MKNKNSKTPGAGELRISVKPGRSAIEHLAAAGEKRVRAGAGLISLKHFLWPDYRMLPVLVHPAGKALAHARRR